MGAQGIDLFDFNLPNATTWFYFSLLLALAAVLQVLAPVSSATSTWSALFLRAGLCYF